jgi:predicted GNAT family acetyltransferase
VKIGILKKTKFQNETETLKMWYRIFGKKGAYGIPDKEYPDNTVFIKRIEHICKNASIQSRFWRYRMIVGVFTSKKYS